MKRNQIEKLLDNTLAKFIRLVESKVTDALEKELFIKALNNGYFAGGCFASMIEDKYINDFDFYFHSKEDADIANFFIRKHLKELIVADTPNAITMKNKLQFILKYYGKPFSLINTFDFKHLKAFHGTNCRSSIPDVIYRLINDKELVYTGSKFPLASLLRTRKYIRRGWYLSANNMIAILFDVMAVMNQNKYVVEKEKEYNEDDIFNWKEDFFINVDLLVEQMSGIDPLIIMERLKQNTGQTLSLNHIIEILNR